MMEFFYGPSEVIEKAWSLVNKIGPKYGYSPNSKSMIYDLDDKANNRWISAGLSHTNEGFELLGAPIGSDRFIANFCKEKFEKNSKIISNLIKIGKSHPQQAWCVLNRSTKFKCSYLFRTTPSIKEYANEYNEELELFLNTIVGMDLDQKMIDQALLPLGMGGLGLNINASEYADQQYIDSMLLTHQLTRYITHNEIIQLDYYRQIRNKIKKEKQIK